MNRNDLREVIARAICRVQLNGGDPDQPAVRWNGTEIEPQSFPAWRDYLDEARHSLSAIEAAGMRIVPSEPTEAMIAAGWIDKEDVNPDDIYCAMLAATPQGRE